MIVELKQVDGRLRTDGDRWYFLLEFRVTADGKDAVWNEGVDWAEIGHPVRRDFLEMLAADAAKDLELELAEEGDTIVETGELRMTWQGQDDSAQSVAKALGFG